MLLEPIKETQPEILKGFKGLYPLKNCLKEPL